MRICIPITFKAQGGGFYFLQNFESYLEAAGWTILRDVKKPFQVLFTNHWMTPKNLILKSLRYNPRARIVQRIDGAAQDYGRFSESDVLQADVNKLSDLTIFQSAYARHATREKFSIISQDGIVIHNPVDTEMFTPEGTKTTLPGQTRIACLTWSTNPLKGAANIYATAKANPSSHFFLCGNYPDAPDLHNLHNLGVLNRQRLAEILRSCHTLLTYSQNEACPNHVLEALASGLPVLYKDSGAMSELVGDCGLPVSVDTFSSQMKRLIRAHKEISIKSRQRALTRFHPDVVFPQYIQAIEAILDQPPNIPALKRQILAWSCQFKC